MSCHQYEFLNCLTILDYLKRYKRNTFVHASKVFIKAKILKTVYSNSSKVCYSNSPVNSSNAATGKMFKHSQTNQERGHSI